VSSVPLAWSSPERRTRHGKQTSQLAVGGPPLRRDGGLPQLKVDSRSDIVRPASRPTLYTSPFVSPAKGLTTCTVLSVSPAVSSASRSRQRGDHPMHMRLCVSARHRGSAARSVWSNQALARCR
jgi:hypothetical protein